MCTALQAQEGFIDSIRLQGFVCAVWLLIVCFKSQNQLFDCRVRTLWTAWCVIFVPVHWVLAAPEVSVFPPGINYSSYLLLLIDSQNAELREAEPISGLIRHAGH